ASLPAMLPGSPRRHPSKRSPEDALAGTPPGLPPAAEARWQEASGARAMSVPSGMNTPTPVEVAPPVEVRNNFIKNLRKSVGYLTEIYRASLAYVSPAGVQWAVPGKSCTCSHTSGPALPCLNGAPVPSRQCKLAELWYKNRKAGSLLICCEQNTHPVV